MKAAVVIGSGAGGAAAARELQGRFDVTIIEKGKPFRPFSMNLSGLERLRKTGLFFDERLARLIFPPLRIRKASDRMVLVRGIATGGTTTICTGNALRLDHDLRKLGIDLDEEFAEISAEIHVSTAHRKGWRPTTESLYGIFEEMGMNPLPTPKMGRYERCRGCGRCLLGCPFGIKWDSRRYLQDALDRGARLLTGRHVDRVVMAGNKAAGVEVRRRGRTRFYPADLIVLAAGGMGTPVILQNSGIECEPRLFVDPVLCVAAERRDSFQNREVSMPFIVQRDRFIVSPYFDYLSFFFNRNWRLPSRSILSLMIKLADSPQGLVSGRKVDKKLTAADRKGLAEGVRICVEVFDRLGVKKDRLFLGTVNAGHPGGMLPLTKDDTRSLHPSRLPSNLYVADATLLPRSLGNPPILTITALAKKVAKRCVFDHA